MIKLEWIVSHNLPFHGKTAFSLGVFNYMCLPKKEKGIQREREEMNAVGDSTCYFTQWEYIPERAHDGRCDSCVPSTSHTPLTIWDSHHPIKKCMFFVRYIIVHDYVPEGT